MQHVPVNRKILAIESHGSTRIRRYSAGKQFVTRKGGLKNRDMSMSGVRSFLLVWVMIASPAFAQGFGFPALAESSRSTHLSLWATHYYVHASNEQPGGVPLLDLAGQPLGAMLSEEDWCNSAVEGTVRVTGSTPAVYNFAGTGEQPQVDCTRFFSRLDAGVLAGVNRSRFAAANGSFGDGVQGMVLVPYRTIAVDSNQSPIPFSSVVYIPAAQGVEVVLPNGTRVLHDGYFFAADTGGAIKDNHLDVFTGISTETPFDFIQSVPARTFEAWLVQDEEISNALRAAHHPADILRLARDGTAEEVRAMLRAGADVGTVDDYGQTPLIYAAQGNSDPEVTQLLVEAGADVNVQTIAAWTPLMYAAHYNSPEVLLALLSLGAEVSAQNEEGVSALELSRDNMRLSATPALALLEVSDFFTHRLSSRYLEDQCTPTEYLGWEGFPTVACTYEVTDDDGTHKSARVIMLNASPFQLARWVVSACLEVTGEPGGICAEHLSEEIIHNSGAQFPVAGIVYEDILPADGIFEAYSFRDGVTVGVTGLEHQKTTVLTSEDQQAALEAEVLWSGRFARIIGTTREQYLQTGGLEDVGDSAVNRKLTWLKVVATLYQNAWGKDRNELIIAWARGQPSSEA